MNRLKKLTLCAVLFLSVLGFSGVARAELEERDTTLFGYYREAVKFLDIQAFGSLDFYSKYIWRGFALDKDPVLQPSFSLSSHGLTFTAWGNMDTDNSDSLDSNEIDLTVDYTKTFGIFSVSAGHTYYDFIGTNGYSKEFYVGAGLSQIPGLDWPVTLGFKYYRDYGDQNHGGGLGNYFETALGYSFALLKEPQINMDLGVVNGYNHNLFMAGDGGQTTLSAGFSIPLTKSLIFKPKLNYTIPYGDLADDNIGNQDDLVWGGFSMSYSF